MVKVDLMGNGRRLTSLALLAAFGLLLLGAAVPEQSRSVPQSKSGVGSQASHGLIPATEITSPDTAGYIFHLSGTGPEPVILAFFCGCDRCRVAARQIAAMQKRTGRPMNFVAVVTLPRHDVIAFQKESALRGRFLVDPDGRVAAAYDAEACPRIFAIDENKTLVYQSAAALEGSAVDASLQAAIATLARPVADPEFLNP